jgi:hypothetical protein
MEGQRVQLEVTRDMHGVLKFALLGCAWSMAASALSAQESRQPPAVHFAKAHMIGLAIAIRGFEKEYGNLPAVATEEIDPIASGGEIISILYGGNTRKINFWEPPQPQLNGGGAAKNPAGAWELHDPWGHLYRIHLDKDGDGQIPNPAAGSATGEPNMIQGPVLIYSAGPDGDFATWKDNVCSWR